MKRPKGVWLVSIYFMVSVLVSVVIFYLAVGGALTLPPELQAQVNGVTVSDHVTLWLSLILSTGGSVSLFRMKKASFKWYATLLGANMLGFLWPLLDGRGSSVMKGAGGNIFGMCIIGAVLVYIRRLEKRNLLS